MSTRSTTFSLRYAEFQTWREAWAEACRRAESPKSLGRIGVRRESPQTWLTEWIEIA